VSAVPRRGAIVAMKLQVLVNASRHRRRRAVSLGDTALTPAALVPELLGPQAGTDVRLPSRSVGLVMLRKRRRYEALVVICFCLSHCIQTVLFSSSSAVQCCRHSSLSFEARDLGLGKVD